MTRFNDGFLMINKPLNWTSNDVVKKIKSLDKSLKIGHGGTLDPSVTGVLPIAIGDATRLISYLKGSKVTYFNLPDQKLDDVPLLHIVKKIETKE